MLELDDGGVVTKGHSRFDENKDGDDGHTDAQPGHHHCLCIIIPLRRLNSCRRKKNNKKQKQTKKKPKQNKKTSASPLFVAGNASYKSLCLSVGQSVTLLLQARKRHLLPLPKSLLPLPISLLPLPISLLPLPNHPRQGLCIRPCLNVRRSMGWCTIGQNTKKKTEKIPI